LTEGGTDEEGRLHKVRKFDDSLIAEFFSREVFSLLLRERLISLELGQKILHCRQSEFIKPTLFVIRKIEPVVFL